VTVFFTALFLLATGALAQPVQELCKACHLEQVTDWETHRHAAKQVACDACHGASTRHRTSVGNVPPDRIAGPAEQARLCGACHAKPAQEYSGTRHGALVLASSRTRAAACTTCHGTHTLRTVAAMEKQCARCHASLPAPCKPTGCATCHKPHQLAARR